MRPPKRGFSLIEILIVVIILAILGAIVLAQYTNVMAQANQSNIRENLAKIRAQIQIYRQQHTGYPSGAGFIAQVTQYTDLDGNVVATRDGSHPYGPYLERMPVNPITNYMTVRAATSDFAAPNSNAGWWYNENTGEIRADLVEGLVDDHGTAYNQY
jgi:general secretion pathway protein G